MTRTTDSKELYLTHFDRFEKNLNGGSKTPIHQIRRSAIERFGAVGFPTTRDEEWRYTNLAALTRTDFVPVVEPDFTALSPADLAPFAFAGLKGIQLVFVDGHYAPHLSRSAALPSGALVTSLAKGIVEHADLVEPHLGRHASYEGESFTALNTAFMRDGALLYLPHNAIVEQPIHLLFVASGGQEPTVSYPRVLLVADEGSQITLIESYVSAGDGHHLTDAVTEIVVGANASVDHYRLQRENGGAYHISDLHARQQRDARFRSTCITLGGRLTRNHVHTLLDGEGIDSTLNGLYLSTDRQHVDNHTLIEHARPNCSSHEFYKGILDGESTGVFRGQILVHQEAQKTDAYQANQNLLLSEAADINTKPQLEIYADDVKCSHGATVGQLDRDSIFYLRSRGIGFEVARNLLMHAFAGEIVDRVRIESVRDRLDELVTDRLTHSRIG